MNLLLQQPGRTPTEEIVRRAVIDEAKILNPKLFDSPHALTLPHPAIQGIAGRVGVRTGIVPHPRAVWRAIEGHHVWMWVHLDGPKRGKIRKEPRPWT